MSLQGRANGLLGQVLGHAVFAAFVSFVVGLLCVGIALVVSARSRGATRRLVALLRELIVDSTDLPPGGRQRLGVLRILGVLIVLASLALAAGDRLQSRVPLWAPLLPFVSGTLTSVQQAFNGHIRAATGSAVVATTVDFTVGFAALVVGTLILLGSGVPWSGFPASPGQWWILLGGAFGVVFIALTTVNVARLGGLLLSLFALFGNLVGALALDALLPIPGSDVTLTTVLSAAGVLVGIVTVLPVPVMRSSGSRREPASRT